MTLSQVALATLISALIVFVLYRHIGIRTVMNTYRMWLTREYWTDYNIVEAASWVTKAVIIIPGLIFGVQIWQLYFIALLTSAALIWASNKKLLPTLVGFNTLWIWLSVMVLVRNMI